MVTNLLPQSVLFNPVDFCGEFCISFGLIFPRITVLLFVMMERETAQKEGREPVLLPHFTCHQLRHTFCTRLCEFEKRPKFVQYVMGQADIKTTMDVYAEVDKNAQKEASLQWQGSVFIK